MALYYYSPVVVAVVIVVLWSITEYLWLRPKRIERLFRKQGLKGNPYKPILGDALVLWRLTKHQGSLPSIPDDPLPGVTAFFHNSIHKHGKISFAWILSTPWIILTVPEVVKEMLHRHEHFQKPNHPINKSLLVGLFGREGQEWAKHRKIINPAFHIKKLKNLLEVIHVSCCEMTKGWEDMISDKGWIELDVWPYLEQVSADIISRAAFGTDFEQGRTICDFLKEHVNLLMQSQESNYIPGWRLLPTKKNRRLRHICKEVNALLTEMVDSRKKELEDGASCSDNLLDTLLESNKNEIEQDGKGLKTKHVVEECKLFYFAGQETTSSLLVWTLVLLCKHRVWQDRARAEVFLVFGKDNKPDFQGLNHLKVVSMILYEVLRLYSPAYAIMRKVYDDMKLGDMLFPKGTEFIIPTSILHRDHELWGEDANIFNPARFSEGVAQATNGQGGFLPFGAGPRNCIGQNLSLIEAKLALVTILRLFDLDLAQNYVHAPFAGFTLKPQCGANLVLRKL